MTAFLTHFTLEFQTGIRNRSMLLMNYLFPLGFYALVGLIMTQINPMFTDQLIPAMVLFTAIVTTILALPEPLVSARENGILRSYKVNGVPATSILVIPALSTILHTTIVSLIILLSAPIFFSAPIPSNLVWFFVVFLAATLAHAGLGILIGVVSPSSRVTILISQAIFLPAMLLSGLMMPYNLLPDGIAKIAQVFPATHAMNAMMGLSMGAETFVDPIVSVILLVTGALVAFALALYLFSWDSKNETRRGSPWLAVLAMIPYFVSLFI